MPKKYLHDKTVLVLLSVIVFMVALTIISILIRLGSSSGLDYFVEYRSNVGISAFRTSGVSGILEFIWFILLVSVSSVILSIRTYRIKRQLAQIILAFGVLLCLLTFIVSYSLLSLR